LKLKTGKIQKSVKVISGIPSPAERLFTRVWSSRPERSSVGQSEPAAISQRPSTPDCPESLREALPDLPTAADQSKIRERFERLMALAA
jgi:hypothetical protein